MLLERFNISYSRILSWFWKSSRILINCTIISISLYFIITLTTLLYIIIAITIIRVRVKKIVSRLQLFLNSLIEFVRLFWIYGLSLIWLLQERSWRFYHHFLEMILLLLRLLLLLLLLLCTRVTSLWLSFWGKLIFGDKYLLLIRVLITSLSTYWLIILQHHIIIVTISKRWSL